jgi:hypothetical protein
MPRYAARAKNTFGLSFQRTLESSGVIKHSGEAGQHSVLSATRNVFSTGFQLALE